MRNVFALPVIGLVVACTQAAPEESDRTAAAEGDAESAPDQEGGEEGESPVVPGISIVLTHEPGSCDTNTLNILARVSYTGGDLVDSPTCHFAFEDGTEITGGCYISPSLPTQPQRVVVTATDPATGATATATDSVQGPATLSATVDLTTTGLSITWDVHTLYGEFADGTDVLVSIDPSGNVVESGPDLFRNYQGTVNVTQPGTYTVTVGTGVSFGEAGGCATQVSETVEVASPPPPPPPNPCDKNADGDTSDHGECDHTCYEGE